MNRQQAELIAETAERCFISPNVPDANGEPANIVDAVELVAIGLRKIANAITPGGVSGGPDAMGGRVESLTEAVMGFTAAVKAQADAVDRKGL